MLAESCVQKNTQYKFELGAHFGIPRNALICPSWNQPSTADVIALNDLVGKCVICFSQRECLVFGDVSQLTESDIAIAAHHAAGNLGLGDRHGDLVVDAYRNRGKANFLV